MKLRSRRYGKIRSQLEKSEERAEDKKEQQVKGHYPFHEIEPKWHTFWKVIKIFEPDPDDVDTSKPKFCGLDIFSYPRFCPLLSLFCLICFLEC